MSWIITKDHLSTEAEPTPNRVGFGAGFLTRDNVQALEGTLVVTDFKLYDDDGELYYEGKITMSRLDADEEKAFAPLHWAMRDAGCTRMDYLDPHTKEWHTL